MQKKKNFIPPFFYEMLLIYCNLVILATLSMPGFDHQKRSYKLVENFEDYLHAKNQIYPSLLFWKIAKILQACYFGYFGNDWPCPPKPEVSTCRKLWCFSIYKSQLDVSLPFWDIMLKRILQSDWLKAFWPITWEPLSIHGAMA